MYSKAFSEIYDAFGWEAFSHTTHALLKKHLTKKENVLDIACGSGTLADLLQKDGHTVTGLDASKDMVRLAKRKNSRITFFVDDMNSFHLPRTYSVITCMFDSVNHIQNWKAFFKRVHRHLEVGGRFVFDFNTANGLRQWSKPFETHSERGVCNFSGEYDSKKKKATLTVTCANMQSKKGTPRIVADEKFTSYTHTIEDVERWLREAGFSFERIGGTKKNPKRVFMKCVKR